MKKIMFSREYGLEQAVLERTKTMTRRVAVLPDGLGRGDLWNPTMGIDERGKVHFTFDCIDAKQRDLYPQYQPGEVLAVAQCYSEIREELDAMQRCMISPWGSPKEHPGWTNKMFVRADLMPHQIRITDVGIEPLQNITDEDSLREGVERWMDCYIVAGIMEHGGKNNATFDTPRQAFASLIDKTCGKATWQRNPWTWNYEFELIR